MTLPKTEWQWHYLLRDHQEAAVDASTLRLKLPVREQISCIEVEARGTVIKPDWDHSIVDTLKKIEVIADGAKVLYSCIPETAAFLHFTQIRSTPNMTRRDKVDKEDTFRVKICFGRYQRDEQYLLDTSVYNNVYLEIPWEQNTTYFKTLYHTWTIRYLRPIQHLAPVGFIRSRDIEYDQHAWTATGQYGVDLPLKYPWYMVGVRIYDVDEDMWNDITHIKLDIDDGRLVLVDDDLDDLLTVNTERLPYPVHIPHEIVTTSPTVGSQIRTYLGDLEEITVTPYQTTMVQVGTSPVKGQRAFIFLAPSPGSGANVAGDVNVSLWGTAYMCCIIIKDWYMDWFEPTPHDPFPVADHSMARLVYSHGAFTITDLRTFLQEVCPLSI